jgi:hypothetical protein
MTDEMKTITGEAYSTYGNILIALSKLDAREISAIVDDLVRLRDRWAPKPTTFPVGSDEEFLTDAVMMEEVTRRLSAYGFPASFGKINASGELMASFGKWVRAYTISRMSSVKSHLKD